MRPIFFPTLWPVFGMFFSYTQELLPNSQQHSWSLANSVLVDSGEKKNRAKQIEACQNIF